MHYNLALPINDLLLAQFKQTATALELDLWAITHIIVIYMILSAARQRTKLFYPLNFGALFGHCLFVLTIATDEWKLEFSVASSLRIGVI